MEFQSKTLEIVLEFYNDIYSDIILVKNWKWRCDSQRMPAYSLQNRIWVNENNVEIQYLSAKQN